MVTIERINGQSTWTKQPGDAYLATGVDVYGRRFTRRSSVWMQIAGINLHKGSRWLLRDGKRHLISRAS